MNVQLSYKSGKTPEVEREFQTQIEKLERRLQVFKPDLVYLRASVEPAKARSTIALLNLRLPSGQMTTQKSGETPVAAVKSAFADLVMQLTRHKDLLRGRLSGKLRRGERGLREESAIAFEPPAVSTSQPAVASASPAAAVAGTDVENWVSANLPSLREFIESELQFRAGAGQIREGQIQPEEVIDEVMVSALSPEEARPQLLSPEGWFHRLALQAIRRLVHSNADIGSVSLDESAGVQNVTGSDEDTLQYHQPDDRPQEEAVIRDRSVSTPEEIFAGEEMVAQLDRALLGVGRQDREAFILFTLEGFTVEEIARLSDRPPDQVRKSIHHARTRVQQKLPEQSQFWRSLLSRSRVA